MPPHRSAMARRQRRPRSNISAMCRSTPSMWWSAATTRSSTRAFPPTSARICARRSPSTSRCSSTGRTRSHTCRPATCGSTSAPCGRSGRIGAGSFATVKPGDLRKVLGRIRRNGALTIRDIDDDVLVEKEHEWASRKPSKRALQLAFYGGSADGQPARRHAENLRPDDPAFRLGANAEGRIGT